MIHHKLPSTPLVNICVSISTSSQHTPSSTPSCLPSPDQTHQIRHLFELAHRHGLLPELYQSIPNTYRQKIDRPLFSTFKNKYMEQIAFNRARLNTLLELLSTLQKHDIPVIPLKGPILTKRLYGSVTHRRFEDLDLLVSPAHVSRASAILQDRGYKRKLPLPKKRSQLYIQKGVSSEYLFHKFDGSRIVELHWALSPRVFSFPVSSFRQIYARTTAITLKNQTINVLKRDDLLLYLCIHGTKHQWSQLKWIRDVARIISQSDQSNLTPLVQKAETLGRKRIFLLGVLLAHTFFSSPLPSPLKSKIRRDHILQQLHNRTCKNLIYQDRSPSFFGDFTPYHLLSFERFRDQLSHSIRMLTSVSVRDLHAIPLPSWLFFLYPLIRLIRIVVCTVFNVISVPFTNHR